MKYKNFTVHAFILFCYQTKQPLTTNKQTVFTA